MIRPGRPGRHPRAPRLGAAARTLRVRARLSQRQVAERIGWSRQRLSVFEADRQEPRWSTVCLVAWGIGTHPAALVHEAMAALPSHSRRAWGAWLERPAA